MSAPLLIPASRDPGDTRPDASGQIPSVHYNIPMYQPLQTDAGLSPVNPLTRMLYRGTAATLQSRHSQLQGIDTCEGINRVNDIGQFNAAQIADSLWQALGRRAPRG